MTIAIFYCRLSNVQLLKTDLKKSFSMEAKVRLHVLEPWLLGKYLTLLNFCFLLYRMGFILSMSQVCCENMQKR